MMALAVLVAVVPPVLFGWTWRYAFYEALVILVIACPCALVISTPVSIVAGLASAARAGVLIKGGVYLEAPGRMRVVAIDKTGTLTTGEPAVQTVVARPGYTGSGVLAWAAAVESHSEHPIARAIRAAAAAEDVETPASEAHRAHAGEGASAMADGATLWVGRPGLAKAFGGALDAEALADFERLEDAGHTVVCVGRDQDVAGFISVADRLREGAAEAVAALHGQGVRRVAMLTGDNAGTARAVAEACGIDDVRWELLPEEKVRAVEDLVRQEGQVAMVGDGINDAPAMAAASLGVAMGAAGTDAAIETADIALMGDDLRRLPWLVGHSRRALRIIQANITLALGIKALFLVLAFAGYATIWMAIAADMGATLLVVANGLRLLRAHE
jgi:Cd2+/Zn2+-exporting ATPase